MGNGASRKAAEEDSPSDAIGDSGSSPADTEGTHLQAPPRISLDRESLCKSLRERGLCIGEGDLKSVLAKYNNPIEALTYVIESGLARRRVKGQHGALSGRTRKTHQKGEALALPTPSPPTTVKQNSQKRARQGDASDTSPIPSRSKSERPLKRAAAKPFISMDSSPSTPDTLFDKAFDGSGLGDLFVHTDVSALVDGADSSSSSGGEDRSREAGQTEQHAQLPVQPDSPPKPSPVAAESAPLKLVKDHATCTPQCPEPSSPPWKVIENITVERSFERLPDNLKMGKMGHTIVLRLEGWGSKNPAEKEVDIRAVMRDLQLPPVESERKEKLERRLLRCLRATLGDLAGVPNLQDCAFMVSHMVEETRKVIHDTSAKVSGEYRQLYQSHPLARGGSKVGDNAPPESAPKHASTSRQLPGDGPDRSRQQRNEQRPPRVASSSPSLDSRSSSENRSSQQPLRTWPRPRHATLNGSVGSSTAIVFGPSRSNHFSFTSATPRLFFSRPNEPKSPPMSTPSSASRGGGRVNEAPAAAVAAARAQWSPEEDAFWSSCSICKEALRRTAFARKEGEWLERQEKLIRERVESTNDGNAQTIRIRRDMVAKLEGEVRSTSEKLEASTADVISAHLAPTLSTEDALRSLLATLQQGENQSAHEKLDARKRALNTHASMSTTLEAQSRNLMLVGHAAQINTVLCEELFGDLLEIVFSRKEKADARRLSCQDDLKCNARHVLEKLKGAISFHVDRKSTAEAKINDDYIAMERDRRLFGDGNTSSLISQAQISEMRVFAQDSAEKMATIKRQAEALYLKLKVDLPEEEFVRLSEGAREFFLADETESADAESRGESPGSFEKALSQRGAALDDGDECKLM